MRFLFFTILFSLFLFAAAFAQNADSTYDDNTAFFEGNVYTYIIHPPAGFKMNTEESTDDGYSFAFIPVDESYEEATVIIGINIFKLKEETRKNFNLNMLVNDDTTSIRKHYGKDITIEEVKPIKTLTGDQLRTVYFNSPEGCIPNVMRSYLDGKSEVLIFDLAISNLIPRFKAEKKYLECLENMKVLTKGTIEVG